jgi:hypothetical protein
MPDLIDLLRRAARKPPRELARRALAEAVVRTERVRTPLRESRLTDAAFLARLDAEDVDELWNRIRSRPYIASRGPRAPDELEEVCSGEVQRVRAAADAAASRTVDLLGTGSITLSTPVDWHVDVKTGRRWEPAYARSISYVEWDDASDVKVPWEISRLQWLLPCAQAYIVDRDDRWAEAAATIIDEWIEGNPYARSVNWCVAMEPALRILTWTYLFHAFADAPSWRPAAFRGRFLRALYLHADYVERHIERSDVNGNHYDADAAGLVFAGLFFGAGRDAERWLERGWRILVEELPRQVGADGVDYEASTSYHRLVTELFLLPALYRERHGLPTPDAYRERVAAMAHFSSVYTRVDGTSPFWGDADDARALPLGGQPLSDHRYLGGLVAAAWGDERARREFAGSRAEVAWLLGYDAAATLVEGTPPGSEAFRDAGVFVLRRDADHVFVDCGPVGLAGRGGHGHNDALSFEAALAGRTLISDAGSFVYTASPAERNRFRATRSHNTPVVDEAEQATLVPQLLWSLGNEAEPFVDEWRVTPEAVAFRGGHKGYLRLPRPVEIRREIELRDRRLAMRDSFTGAGEHEIEVPLLLAAGVAVERRADGAMLLGDGRFVLRWSDADEWTLTEEPGWVSPSYGVRVETVRLVWRRTGPLRPLTVEIAAAEGA